MTTKKDNDESKVIASSDLSSFIREKGLYMLATILKSKKATQTTIKIIETFSKIKKLNSNINKIQIESIL